MVPQMIFFTKGAGVHKNELCSFEEALRRAGIEKLNIVTVSSILPPYVKILPSKRGIELLKPGQITFMVLARNCTNEPNRLISAAIGVAKPADPDIHGYLSEHHTFGETAQKSGDYAEDLAATMLATTLGLDFNIDTDWDERKQFYHASGKIIKTNSICQSAEGDKKGLWTTVVAAAVFIM